MILRLKITHAHQDERKKQSNMGQFKVRCSNHQSEVTLNMKIPAETQPSCSNWCSRLNPTHSETEAFGDRRERACSRPYPESMRLPYSRPLNVRLSVCIKESAGKGAKDLSLSYKTRADRNTRSKSVFHYEP